MGKKKKKKKKVLDDDAEEKGDDEKEDLADLDLESFGEKKKKKKKKIPLDMEDLERRCLVMIRLRITTNLTWNLLEQKRKGKRRLKETWMTWTMTTKRMKEKLAKLLLGEKTVITLMMNSCNESIMLSRRKIQTLPWARKRSLL